MSKSRSASLKKESRSPSLPADTNNVKMQDGPVDFVKAELSSKQEPQDGTLPKAEPTPPHSTKQGSTPPADVKPIPKGPQLIGHLPRAEEDAMKTFVEITHNHYQYQTLGRSREAQEGMTCDCVYDHGVDSDEVACGDGSDCINRLTQVECLPEDCRCRRYCQNQRFQRRQYAPIEIVQTEKKGFGLRAAEDLPRDTFIYEYVGDVIANASFAKRMREYAEEGIRHFYFMMLQKDEFIDATKRGGIGRFANHSCNPNCYVAKWTVGDHVRMGIFAHRRILKDEELTFNYNVDRYGHDAQPCYCGEAKCVGFIGGKTQTDIGAMDDLYLDALGISDEVDRLGLKGNKKRKGKKLDEDYVPILKPLLEKDIPKLVQAMRQTQSRKVLLKLLTRIKITEDQSALRQIMRLRGFSLMTNVMDDYEDNEMRLLAIECMSTWPLINRNKVDDSKINVPVQACAESDDENLKKAAQKLLDKWSLLETAYRIPKRLKANGDCEDTPSPLIFSPAEPDNRPIKRSRMEAYENAIIDIKPLGWNAGSASRARDLDAEARAAEVLRKEAAQAQRKAKEPSKADIQAVIAAAAAAEQAKQLAAAEAARLEAEAAARKKSGESKEDRERRRRERKEREAKRREAREANKDKRLLKLVGAVVVKCMSKYRSQMEVDAFKKHAKELTHVIAEKEKKSTSYKEGKLDALSDEKVNKIKKFAKEYIHKVLHKLAKSGKLLKRPPDSAASSSGANGREGESGAKEMTVEEAMDMSDDEHEHEHDDKDSDMDEDGKDERTPVEPAESDTSTAVTDPRRRAHSGDEPGKGWDPHAQAHAVFPPPTDALMEEAVQAVDAMEVAS